MPPSDRELADLAAAVADGASPDWADAESSAADEKTRTLIGRLRTISEIARAHDADGMPSGEHSPVDIPAAAPAGFSGNPGQWGPLRILEHVASGRFGDVYRAFDPNLDRDVALKLLRHRTSDPGSEDTTLDLRACRAASPTHAAFTGWIWRRGPRPWFTTLHRMGLSALMHLPCHLTGMTCWSSRCATRMDASTTCCASSGPMDRRLTAT